MIHYYAVVHKDEDSAFGVSFPDLPGCFSAADHEDELLENATQALELWFDDADEVEPCSADEIRDLAKDELAAGAYLLAVPFMRR